MKLGQREGLPGHVEIRETVTGNEAIPGSFKHVWFPS